MNYVLKVGNAVIFPDRSGILWMVYVSVSLGGWSGSALNIKTSQDEGRTWGESHRLTLNPFFNLSSLVRNKPIYASDGQIGLPVYHEIALKYPQMLWLTPSGRAPTGFPDTESVVRDGLIQPALVALDTIRADDVRDRGAGRRLHTAYSEDTAGRGRPRRRAGCRIRIRRSTLSACATAACCSCTIMRRAAGKISGWRFRPRRANLAKRPDDRRSRGPGVLVSEYGEDQRGRIHLT